MYESTDEIFFMPETVPLETVPEIDFSEEINQDELLLDRATNLDSIENAITDNNGVNQEIATTLESIAEGFHKLSRNNKSYTHDYTFTNMKVTLEDMETIRKGLRLGILALMIAIIAKIGTFIYRAWSNNKDEGNKPGKIGQAVNDIQKARMDNTRTLSLLIHNTINVHNNLVPFINEKLGNKLTTKLTTSNINSVMNDTATDMYKKHISKVNCIMMQKLISSDGAFIALVNTVVELLAHLEYIQTAFNTVSALDLTGDMDFKASSIGFNHDKVTQALTKINVSGDTTTYPNPIDQLQKEVVRLTKIDPALSIPTNAHIQSFDSTHFGSTLGAFNHDDALAKQKSLETGISTYTEKVKASDLKNGEIDAALKTINTELISYGKLLDVLHKTSTAFSNYMVAIKASELEIGSFEVSIVDAILKSKDILAPAEKVSIKETLDGVKKKMKEARA